MYTVLSSLLIAAEEQVVTREDLVYKKGLYYLKSTNEPFSGVRTYRQHLSDNTYYKSELTYVDGLANGVELTYLDGIKVSQRHYLQGKMYGSLKVWYKSGALRSERNFNQGELEGKMIEYYESGVLQRETTYAEDSMIYYTMYTEDGVIERLYSSRKGRRHGLDTKWHQDGYKQSETNYVNGDKVGRYVRYNSDGSIDEEKIYEAPKDPQPELKETIIVHDVTQQVLEEGVTGRDGVLCRNDNDEPFSGTYIKLVEGWYSWGKYTTEYVNGKKHGKDRIYYTNGNIYSEYHYINGQLEGPYISYYETGEKSGESVYVDGLREGARVSYHKNGGIQQKEHYKNSQLDGLKTTYRKDGSKASERLYKEGVHITKSNSEVSTP